MTYPVLLLGFGIQLSHEIIPFQRREIIQSTIKESTEYLLDADSQSNHKYIVGFCFTLLKLPSGIH